MNILLMFAFCLMLLLGLKESFIWTSWTFCVTTRWRSMESCMKFKRTGWFMDSIKFDVHSNKDDKRVVLLRTHVGSTIFTSDEIFQKGKYIP